jgi:putative DNA methylase
LTTTYKKKLIEVAIPLEAINAASAREKSIRHGHPSTLHLWWARRPLAACRAVLFAQLVDDPSSLPDQFPTAELQDAERKRLFAIIEDLVIWENSTNDEVIERARAEIFRSCGGELPPVYDPFSGGGAIPLESLRLGMPTYGSDLNPVAVLIGKAMIEIPPRFRDRGPIHSGPKARIHYRNAEGLAEDVKHYGDVVRDLVWRNSANLYPQADVPADLGGGKATVIAWIWSRTVPSPDPAFHGAHVPIASSFRLCTKSKQEAWIQPIVDRDARTISYVIRRDVPTQEWEEAGRGTKEGRGANFRCLLSGAAITPEYVKKCGKSGQFGQTLIAMVAEGPNGRLYLAPDSIHINQSSAPAIEMPFDDKLSNHPQYIGVLSYGITKFKELFTDRQLYILDQFSSAISNVHDEIIQDALSGGFELGLPLRHGGDGAMAYAEAIKLYLSFLVDQMANNNSIACSWHSRNSQLRSVFSRQAIQMTWDFAESNPFCESSGSFYNLHTRMVKAFDTLGFSDEGGSETQEDARTVKYIDGCVISTDPPYYDNIPYADLSDFFYIWLRRNVSDVFPDLMGTVGVPKMDELVADRMRHGGPEKAGNYFLNGMKDVVKRMADFSSNEFPATIYYAFKQSEIDQEGVSSTGWATFLEAIVSSGFSVVGTWPIRTELVTRMRGNKSNALANSVVLVCRKKDLEAETLTRAEFVRILKKELPAAIAELQVANITPADMPQAAIGPGMGVFSRYKNVLESDDNPMSVKTALQLINRELDEYFGVIQGEFDADTRFAITWFEQFGNGAGDYGIANSIATARGISVDRVKHAGIVESAAGKVRILSRAEINSDWDPSGDAHLTIWECLQHVVKAHENDGLASSTAELLHKIGSNAEAVKDLAYCLYDICANKRKDAKEATAYNALIADWAELTRLSASALNIRRDSQMRLDV